jgi:hypothetical protein
MLRDHVLVKRGHGSLNWPPLSHDYYFFGVGGAGF